MPLAGIFGPDDPIYFAAGAPASTGAGTDTAFPFTESVRAVMIQNNTTAIVDVAFDQAATAGSFVLAASGTPQIFYIPCSTLHLLTAAAHTVNGTAALGIVVVGVK